MNTILVSVVLVIFVSLLIVIALSPVEYDVITSHMEDRDLIKMTLTPHYVGGLETVLENTKCKLILLKDKLIVKIAFKGIDFTIPFDRILNVEIKNLEQLNEDIAISQLFSTKSIYIPRNTGKNKENEFIVINYINCKNEEKTLILQYDGSREFIDKYRETFIYWKCGYSNCDISEHAISLNLT